MSTSPSPFQDHAAPVLASDPSLSDQQRSDLWDAFHSKNSDELVQYLTPLPIPDDTKHKLFQAKQLAAPPVKVEPVDKVTAAVNKMVALPPDVLDKAEQHPNVLKAFTTAATAVEPAVGKETSSGGETAPKQPAGGKNAQSAPLVQSPRADGQPHLPSIPDGHHRVLSGNGGIYDIPQERIEDARKIDPSLHVLNPPV